MKNASFILLLNHELAEGLGLNFPYELVVRVFSNVLGWLSY